MSAIPTPPLRLQCWDGLQADLPDLWAQAAIENGQLRLGFSLIWQPAGWSLQLPIRQGGESTLPQRRDGLWQHTCFEAFIAAAGAPAYWEFNLSPLGDWNVYRFDGYRAGQCTESAYGQLPLRVIGPRAAPPRGDCRLSAPGALLELELSCALPPMLDNTLRAGAALELGLTAVLETRGGELSYWALQHPGAEPDFHDRRGWLLRL